MARQTTIRMLQKDLSKNGIVQYIFKPPNDTESGWISANTVEFFNEVTTLYGLCIDDVNRKSFQPGEGFPKSMLYTWDRKVETNLKDFSFLTGPQYLALTFSWIESLMRDESLFPQDNENPNIFSPDFSCVIKDVYKELLRSYSILYQLYDECIVDHPSSHASENTIEAHKELNRCFKHFIYFALEWNLIDFKGADARPLYHRITKLKKKFDAEVKEFEEDSKRKEAQMNINLQKIHAI
mmetsp:Transcript_7397/g.9692  ORF Transcript_7397/g.9692 Transcript_7397/m.9692 type:complete len:239 (+) Transcript_7397:241-957(+)